jgi:glutamate synthase domain-containing protein 2
VLLGFGADGVCPYLAYEVLARMNNNGTVFSRSNQMFSDAELFYSYRKAAATGLLKVMSKMGISTLQSYKGAQVFEALGLDDDVMERWGYYILLLLSTYNTLNSLFRCFTGTSSRIKGADFTAIFKDAAALHALAFPSYTDIVPQMRNPGNFHLRNGGEAHLNTPEGMVALQQASRTNSRDAFSMYTAHVDKMNKSVTLRGVIKLKYPKGAAIPLEEVESAASIVKRFNTGAMSLGSISQETHETLAVAMNQIGARSNTGYHPTNSFDVTIDAFSCS